MKKISSNPFVVQHKAVLYKPIGINASYHSGKNGFFYKDKKAALWMKEAVKSLYEQGFRPLPLPEVLYWTDLTLKLYTNRMDIDGPIKPTLDSIMKALSIPIQVGKKVLYQGLDDRFIGHLDIYKFWESPQEKQRIEIDITVYSVRTKEQFNERTREVE